MKILYISSGNNNFGISPTVSNQGRSIKKVGIYVEYFTIKGKGILGYLKNVASIKNIVKSNKFNVIHAHYSLSALAASLAFPKIPIVVSLMGSDTKMNLFWRLIIRFNYKYFWSYVIVKSIKMKEKLNLNNATVIPNGVNLNKFALRSKGEAKIKLGLEKNKKYILFLSNPSRYEKNFDLAKLALDLVTDGSIEMLPVFNIPHNEVVDYFYASHLLLLTSLWEGSPNVIKEAMACNLPIVTTDVGDVKWVLGETPGCFITSYDPKDVAQKIEKALQFAGPTTGRDRILELGLDAETIANKLISIYKNVVH